MSGRKCSVYSFDAAVERRASQLEQLEASVRTADSLKAQVRMVLEGTSEGIKRLCATEAQKARLWLRQSEQESEAGSDTASRLSSTQQQILEGQQILQQLSTALNGVARLKQQLSARFQNSMAEFTSCRAMIQRRLGEEREEALAQVLDEARLALDADALADAERSLETVGAQLGPAIAEATVLENEAIRQEQARDLADVGRKLDACLSSVRQSAQSASPGLQATFLEETRAASDWLERVEVVRSQATTLGDDVATEQMAEWVSRLRSELADGQRVAQGVGSAYGERAAELRADAEALVHRLEGQFEAGRELLLHWFGAEETAQIEAGIRQGRDTLRAEYLREVKPLCVPLAELLERKLQQAEQLEAKHQRRLYLLKALRQVCREMGFGEVEDPYYVKQGDRNSRIVATMDTFDHGRVTFHLSLESIEADSCITDIHCFEEFDRLSQQLAEKFGVQTQFRMTDGQELPHLKRKGEREEPSSVGRTAEASL